MHSKTRLFFILTIVILVIGAIGFFYFHDKDNYHAPIPLLTVEEPTVGDPAAPVHVVVFEDPRCNNCVVFHKRYYERLKKEFIDTHKIKYTIFLVGEEPHSETVLRILFCVNQQSTPDFFKVLNKYYENLPLALTDQELEEEMMRLITSLDLNINEARFSSCVHKRSYIQKASENTAYAKAIMGGVIRTPTVYVNGIQLVRPDYNEVEKLIKKELNSR
ncbi:MAG: Disulfide bond formation protein D [Chlamydiia bacterium]|nr:Disulfide bond formation protein D [Chlamydiia bacterium]